MITWFDMPEVRWAAWFVLTTGLLVGCLIGHWLLGEVDARLRARWIRRRLRWP